MTDNEPYQLPIVLRDSGLVRVLGTGALLILTLLTCLGTFYSETAAGRASAVLLSALAIVLTVRYLRMKAVLDEHEVRVTGFIRNHCVPVAEIAGLSRDSGLFGEVLEFHRVEGGPMIRLSANNFMTQKNGLRKRMDLLQAWAEQVGIMNLTETIS